jgi:hypothetical protein
MTKTSKRKFEFFVSKNSSRCRYPRELRLRLKKYHENEAARDQGTPLAAAK